MGITSDVRAYDNTGTCFSFFPRSNDEWRYALDVENTAPDECDYVSSALQGSELPDWVEIEVLAKLTNQPAHLVFRQALAGEYERTCRIYGLEILRVDTLSHWIALGRKREQPS